MRADRLIALLMHLQVRGHTTAKALAERLEVSERTIYRDLIALSTAGVPVYTERGPHGGCVLAEGYRTNLTGLTEDEVRSLFMSGVPTLLDDLELGKTQEAALLKLLAALPSAHRRDAERARLRIHLDATAWGRLPDEVPFLRVIQEALWRDHQLHIHYLSPGGKRTERTISPLGLVAKAHIWYVVSLDEAKKQPRVFRVSRIQAAECLTEPATRPADFDLPAYWNAWCAQLEANWPQYPVTLSFAPAVIPSLIEIFGDGIKSLINQASPVDESGWLTMELNFETFEAARSRALSFGPLARVIAPRELYESTLAFARATVASYSIDQPAPEGS